MTQGGDRRCVVWIPKQGADPRRLPAATLIGAHEPLTGGERSMHELAMALAALGERVELRGRVDADELGLLTAAADVQIELPGDAREIEPTDVVLVPEGNADPLFWAALVLSPGRTIVALLAPTGLFGWTFERDGAPSPPATVALDRLARPGDMRAMVALGLELWTPMPRLAAIAQDAGVPCAWIGSGRPADFPPPGPKRYDVATLSRNKWSGHASAVVARLGEEIVRHTIAGTNPHVLQEFGRTRVVVHPMRIEGHSRVACEARAMGAVPVVLDSNVFGVGLDEASGAVSVPTLDAMPAAIAALLSDPPRLQLLREQGMRSAREQVAWAPYVERVGRALDARPDDPSRAARAEIGRRLVLREDEERQALEHEHTTVLEERLSAIERERDDARSQRDALSAERDVIGAQRDRLAAEVVQISADFRAVLATRAWQLACRFWRVRDRLLRRR